MAAVANMIKPNLNTGQRRYIGEILRQYPIVKKVVEKELDYMFPSVISQYGTERVANGGLPGSSTESFGIKRADMRRLVESVELFLELLTEDELKVIDLAYFQDYIYGYEEMGLSKRSYDRIKQRALDKGRYVFFNY